MYKYTLSLTLGLNVGEWPRPLAMYVDSASTVFTARSIRMAKDILQSTFIHEFQGFIGTKNI
jgi:hypothetical protein